MWHRLRFFATFVCQSGYNGNNSQRVHFGEHLNDKVQYAMLLVLEQMHAGAVSLAIEQDLCLYVQDRSPFKGAEENVLFFRGFTR